MFEMIQNQILIESDMPQMKTITESDYDNIQITDFSFVITQRL